MLTLENWKAQEISDSSRCICAREYVRTRTRTNTNPNDTEADTEANAAGRSGNARVLRKQSKCDVYHEGEGR